MNVVLSLSLKICRRNNLEQRYNVSKDAATVAGNYAMVEVRTGTLPMPDLILREPFIKFLIGTNKELW